MKKKRHLPPLNPLKSFEAAARHGSFSKAARELSVSPVAISRQVGVLEDYLEIKLFDRLTRVVKLTPAASIFQSAISSALDEIDTSTANLKRNARDVAVLRISTYSSFALGWLIPRLHHFREKYPNIEIDMSTVVDPREVDYDCTDLAIIATHKTTQGIAYEPILPDVIQPVCSPELLDVTHPPNFSKNLPFHTRLHSFYRDLDWHYWFKGADIREPGVNKELTFRGSRLTYQAAEAGLGIAIAQRLLIGDELTSGRLIAPLEPAVQRASSYCVTCLEGHLDNWHIRDFREWIREEAAISIEQFGLPTTLPMPTSSSLTVSAVAL